MFAIASLLFSDLPVKANELVPSEDLTGGASAFVFRGSSKRPQAAGASAAAFTVAGGSAGSPAARRARINAQLAAARKRKADAARARAAEIARIRARERAQKLRLSNTLTTRAEALMADGKIDESIPVFREAIKNNPKNNDAISGLSEALTAKGIEVAGESGNQAAIVYLDEAVKLDPKNEVALAKIGDVHDSNGRNSEAITFWEKALAIDPEMSSIYLPLGLAYLEEGKYVEAESYIDRAEKAGYSNTEMRMARISLFSGQGRHSEVLAVLDRVIQAEPTNGWAYYQRALTFTRMGDVQAALQAYRRTVEIDPNNAAAWFEIGVAQYNSGDYAGALASYQNAIRIDPDNPVANANLASTFRQLERFAEANAAYRKAEPGNEKNPDLYSEWGFCLGKTSEWDKAVARLNQARVLSPSAVDNTNLGWAYYNAARQDQAAGRVAEAREKLELARQYLQTAVSLDPKLDAAYLNLGSTNNSLGDHEAAVEALNVALSLRRDWVIAMNQLGIGYKGLKNFAAAIDVLRRVTTLDSRNVFGLYSLGEVYHLSGNSKEAKKIQAQLKKIDPAFASRLDDVFKGKAVVDDAKRKIESKVPRIPGRPF